MASPSAVAAALSAGNAGPAQGAGQMLPFGAFTAGAGNYNQWVNGNAMGVALPRIAQDFISGAFGPLSPLVPMPIDEPGSDGRPLPRRWQYPVGWNLPIGQPGSEGLKLASFGALRRYADIYSVVRAMINIRKDEIAGTSWDVGPTAEVAAATKGDKGAGKDQRERASKIVDWFKHVDPDYYGFQSWFSSLLEELFVIDAVAIHLHPTRVPGKGPFGSDIAALAAINGETIRPLVNIRGATPRPPDVAYQQYLWGVPRTDMMSVITDSDLDAIDDRLAEAGMDFDGKPEKEYRADQLLYLPRMRRVWTPYGFSAIEQAVIPITLGLNRQQFLLDFFMEGTIPGVYVIAGEAYVTPTQQRNLQDSLNALAGDQAWKHRVIVLPPGSKTDPQKDLTWAKDVDANIVEQVAMILHIQPHEIGMVPGGRSNTGMGGKGMAEEQAHAVAQQRTLPELNWWKETVFNWVIQNAFGQKDLEWKWLGWEEEEDQAQAADIATKYISVGGMSIDEDRVNRGLDPWNLPLTQGPVLIAGNTIVPLDPTVPAPPPPPGAPGGVAGAPGEPNANNPAGQALSDASMPTKPGSTKPRENPIANLTHDKGSKRKKARNELVDRFASNLKDQSDAIADAQKEREKKLKDAKSGDKVTVATLLKWRTKYNEDKLDGDDGIVINYLRRSYPPDEVEWAADAKWEFDPHVDLNEIQYADRPGGRDPKKVEAISGSLKNGASMDPVVLVKGDGPKLRVADGYHRLMGAEHAGWNDVPAFIGSGVKSDMKQIQGSMQDSSDSKKKAAQSEIAVLRRWMRKGNDLANFRTDKIDGDILRQLPDRIEKLGFGEAFHWAHNYVAKSGGNPQGLRDWYNDGADGQIDWGSEGDFMQCVNIASEHMDDEDAKGFCNLRHQDAVGVAPGQEKNISLSSPLGTGLVPYDLAGQDPECQRCGSKLNSEGLCPVHGVAVMKYDPAQPRDEFGRWTQGEDLPSGYNAHVGAQTPGSLSLDIIHRHGMLAHEHAGTILQGTFGLGGGSMYDKQYYVTPDGEAGKFFKSPDEAMNFLVAEHAAHDAQVGAGIMKDDEADVFKSVTPDLLLAEIDAELARRGVTF